MWNTGNYSSNSMGPILDDLNLQCYYGHESKVVGEHKLMAYVRVLLHVCVCVCVFVEGADDATNT